MSDEAMAQQIERLQLELDDQKGVAKSWFRKYCENQRRLEECRAEISALQNELGRTRQQLAAAEALSAEAAAAGPIVDNRIKELEAALVEVSSTRAVERVLQAHGDLAAAEQIALRELRWHLKWIIDDLGDLGMSQRAIGRHVGVSAARISCWASVDHWARECCARTAWRVLPELAALLDRLKLERQNGIAEATDKRGNTASRVAGNRRAKGKPADRHAG